MYKERFREWNFVKNLKKDVARGIIRKARQRAGRTSEAVIGPSVFSLGKVARSYDRHVARGKNNIQGKSHMPRDTVTY